MENHQPVIEVNSVCKSFSVGSQDVPVLKNVSVTIKDGDFAIIFGPSGCGKSTLLHTILGLEDPNEGNVVLFGHNLYEGTNEDDRAIFRKQLIGMVFQQSNWIKALDVKENVAFPLTLLGIENTIAQEKALEMLRQVGMVEWADYIPTELSFGQQQRVSLARSLIHNPEVIIADEPTGNLDYESGQQMMQLLGDLNKQHGKTIIMVTHDFAYLHFANYLIQIFDGEVVKTYGSKEKSKLLKELVYKRGLYNKDTNKSK
ncbi:putative ABC transporter ATP-binding protein/MT1014 [bacterium BMS3Abin15]|nr:putative ABC transporter ATP-binding protein/MT1014 [bacterium BMS3Abin15]HDH07735.1 ABC transporter ATP-binding protein [Candidatus Moranbacteria bacterium]HDZ85605.1 ABC transporter ATP-binding protein [Candidatus Moranbacteria bacterium]